MGLIYEYKGFTIRPNTFSKHSYEDWLYVDDNGRHGLASNPEEARRYIDERFFADPPFSKQFILTWLLLLVACLAFWTYVIHTGYTWVD